MVRIRYFGVLFEYIDFFEVVKFFRGAFVTGSRCLFLYSSNVRLITPAIGIASIIPRTPPSVTQSNITMKTKNGERSRARLITYGTRKSFSIR